MPVNWKTAQRKAARTARWAVTMTKVRIRRVLSRTRWQLVTFSGKSGGESVGAVDLVALRKDHGKPIAGTKRGDNFQIILIQVKGGSAAMPTADDRGACVPSPADTAPATCCWRAGRKERRRDSSVCAVDRHSGSKLLTWMPFFGELL